MKNIKSSVKNKFSNLTNDLAIKQSFMQLSNKDQSSIIEEANINREKKAAQKRKVNKADTGDDDEDELREFMKSRPEFDGKKNLTEALKKKLRVLISNKKKLEQTERELAVDKARGIYGNQDYNTSSNSSTSSSSSQVNIDTSTASVNKNLSLEKCRGLDSTLGQASNGSVISETNISNNHSNINNMEESLFTVDDDVFETNDVVNNDSYQNQRPKRIKSTEQSLYHDTFENIQPTIQSTMSEIQLTTDKLTEISSEILKIEQIHESDTRSIIEIQNKQIESFRSDCILKKTDEQVMESDIKNMTNRHMLSRDAQTQSNNLILSNIRLRRDNEQNKLNTLNAQLKELINQKSKTSTISLEPKNIAHRFDNVNEHHDDTSDNNKFAFENSTLLGNSLSDTLDTNKNLKTKEIMNNLSKATSTSLNNPDQMSLNAQKKVTNTENTPTATSKESKNKQNQEKINGEIKANNIQIEPNVSQNLTTSPSNRQKPPNPCTNALTFDSFKQSLSNNPNLFEFTNNLKKQMSNESDFQINLKKRNAEIDAKLNIQLQELKKPDGIRNDYLLPPKTSEDWYDLKYIRPSYDVYLVGSGLKNFSDDIYKRHDEIVRCTGIDKDNIITSTQRIDLRDNTIYYKVAVATLHDFVKILLPWPDKAFGSGIKSMRAPIEFLRPQILDVDKMHDFNSVNATKTIINAEKYWSITNISRSQYYDNKTKVEVVLNKLFCRFTKLNLLSKAMKKKIQLDLTSTSHCVSLGPLKLSSCCSKCGVSGHGEKSCKETNCYRCQGIDHQAVLCKNPLKCANCGGPHLCISDLCPALVMRSIQDNNFICNFELQEEIIRHPIQLFKTRLTPEELDNFYTGKIDEKQVIVDQIREELICSFMPIINNQNQEIEQLKKSVNVCEKRIDKLDELFDAEDFAASFGLKFLIYNNLSLYNGVA